MEFLAVKPCRHDAYEAVPKKKISLDLDEAEKVLHARGYEILANPRVMLVVKKVHEITVYPHGRLFMHPVRDRETAEKIAKELYAALGR